MHKKHAIQREHARTWNLQTWDKVDINCGRRKREYICAPICGSKDSDMQQFLNLQYDSCEAYIRVK